jgi:hypothetical protein
MCVVALGFKQASRSPVLSGDDSVIRQAGLNTQEWWENGGFQTGQCVACGKETLKILFRKAAVPIFVCSELCLQKYFKPIGGVDVPRKLAQSESWLD